MRGRFPVNNPAFFPPLYVQRVSVCVCVCNMGSAPLPVLLSLYQVLDLNVLFLSLFVSQGLLS